RGRGVGARRGGAGVTHAGEDGARPSRPAPTGSRPAGARGSRRDRRDRPRAHGRAMTTTTTDTTLGRALPTEMLERFRARAGELDRTNAYFEEDLAELRDAGYLLAAVPTHHGGWGLDLAAVAAEQRRLARYAPATALSLTMHHYWVGMAMELERAGDTSCSWILEAAAAGEVFAAGPRRAGQRRPRAHVDLHGRAGRGRLPA